jgi:hypothetical protein
MKEKVILPRKVKIILYFTIFTPLIIMILMVLFNVLNENRTNSELYLDYKKEFVFAGKIDTIYHEIHNHNIKVIESNKQRHPLPFEWENKFKVGDSVIKQKDSLTLKLYRNGILFEVLDYRDIVKDWRD